MTDDRLHTLAQLARRVRLSGGYVRAVWAARPENLPPPDEYDAGGRPLWRASTVDRWATDRARVRAVPAAKTAGGA